MASLHLHCTLKFLIMSILALTASAQVTVDAAPSSKMPSERHKDAPEWPFHLGRRVIELERRMPVEDRVVLVPDEATFLDEVAQWSTKGRWPVLIEDSVYTPMFLRTFVPRQIVRRVQRAPRIDSPGALHQVMRDMVIRSFGGNPAVVSVVGAMQTAGFTPTGIAVYAADDPAFVAAAALAVGRGMIPAPIEGGFDASDGRLDPQAFAAFDRLVREAFSSSGLPFEGMGDAMDAAVICRGLATITRLDLAVNKVPSAPGMPVVKSDDSFATSDAVCRLSSGHRYAVCGIIQGSAARSAYVAMASLFLSRASIWAVDSYQSSDAMFQSFRVDSLASALEQAGFQALTRSGTDAGLDAWRQLLVDGFACDVLLLNSSGNADFFDLGTPGQTAASSRGGPGDVPVLTRPLALSLVHSFSLQSPSNPDSVGGRWIEYGAYAYVGSVHEPYLFAFVPPGALLQQVANGVPFGVAARIWDGPFALPWRISLIGDPLMMCVAPKGLPIQPRVDPPPPIPGYLDLFAQCRDLLSRCKGDAGGDATLAAIRALAAIGQDRLVAELWRVMARQSWAARVAPAALDSLFVRRESGAFLAAYALVAAPTPRQRDMLWQLCAPMLPTLRDPDAVLLFERAVRPTWPDHDLRRLLPTSKAMLGPVHARELVIRLRQVTSNPQQRAALDDLLRDL